MLNHLTDSDGVASDQLEEFWNPKSPLYLGNAKNVAPIAAGHGYFTDVGDEAIITFRQKIATKTSQYNLDYWQTEYCLLGDGYKEGRKSRTSFDCGMFLAKIIHYDLTIGNATAWQYWNSFEPGDWQYDTRYYLFAIKPNLPRILNRPIGKCGTDGVSHKELMFRASRLSQKPSTQIKI